MGKVTGFKEFARKDEAHQDITSRIKNYNEFTIALKNEEVEEQAARCMECGIPFCHSGCPLGNLIPDFNDYVYRGKWQKALEVLHSTNNFPEFTGRLCPAPCEKSCVLGIISSPVSIENIEKSIAEKGFAEGWIQPVQSTSKTDKKIAIIGSGPAGLAAAQQLNRAGHTVTVFERDDAIGGLLRYGIPDFKLEKHIIDRRVDILQQEGINFIINAHVGINYDTEKLKNFDAIVLCGGATTKRVLPIEKIDSKGIVQAMDFLKQQNKHNANQPIEEERIVAINKNVIIIGGGDTGSDCMGTAVRQGAKSVVILEIMQKPPSERSKKSPWPFWPLQLKTTSSHEEAGDQRNWSISTKEIITDEQNHIKAIKTVEIEWKNKNQRMIFEEVPNTEKIWDCDLMLLAIGFSGAEKTLSEQLGVEVDNRGNFKTENYQTCQPHIFAAGDMRRGQSLIVWAISEGRECARKVDKFLMGNSNLPKKGAGNMLSA